MRISFLQFVFLVFVFLVFVYNEKFFSSIITTFLKNIKKYNSFRK